MKKILIIYPEYKEFITGGQVYDRNLFETLRMKDNVQIDILTDDMLPTRSKYLYNFAYLAKLRQIRQYDYVLTNSRLYTRLILSAMVLKALYKTPVVSIHHHFNFEGEAGIKRAIHKLLETTFLKLSFATIIPSPYVRDRFRKLLPKSKIWFAELSVKKEDKTIEPRARHNDVFNMLYMGTIENRKGLAYLIDALHLLKNETKDEFHCYIAGKVADESYYNSITEKCKMYCLEKNITFTGRVAEDEKERLYENANCFVFPSLLEGYGMVVLEAMAHGLPVVAFNNSAMPYTVNNTNGILVENKNCDKFKDGIKALMEDEDYRLRLSEGAIQHTRKSRSIDDMNKDINLIIEKEILS